MCEVWVGAPDHTNPISIREQNQDVLKRLSDVCILQQTLCTRLHTIHVCILKIVIKKCSKSNTLYI